MIQLRSAGLLRRLLLFILLFSLCFTVLASSVQLYFEYRREMRDIDSRMELIRAVTWAAWNATCGTSTRNS